MRVRIVVALVAAVGCLGLGASAAGAAAPSLPLRCGLNKPATSHWGEWQTNSGCTVQVGANSVFCGRQLWHYPGDGYGHLLGCRLEAPDAGLTLECGLYGEDAYGSKVDGIGCLDAEGAPLILGCLHYRSRTDSGPVRIVLCGGAGSEVQCWDYSAPSDPDYCFLYLNSDFYCFVFLANPAASLSDCVAAQRLRTRRSGTQKPPQTRGLRQIGAPGFEPGTSPTRTVRATRLRHAPKKLSV
jgi:hypothetical protein